MSLSLTPTLSLSLIPRGMRGSWGGDKSGRLLLDRNWITKHQKVVKKFNKSRSSVDDRAFMIFKVTK